LEVTIITTVGKMSFSLHFISFLKTKEQSSTIDLKSEKNLRILNLKYNSNIMHSQY